MDKYFFSQRPEKVAENLLGYRLVREIDGVKLEGEIVETEAYLGKEDPASHAYNGVTERNRLMYESFGKVYVYICYGVHNMFNITAGEEDVGAVLVRAVKPLEGLEKMKELRQVEKMKELCNGPGKLCQSFGIDKSLNGCSVTEGGIRIVERGKKDFKVVETSRIGISEGKELGMRYCLADSNFLSRKNV